MIEICKATDTACVRRFSDCQKTYAAELNNRAAGELEGARPASNLICRHIKSLVFQGFLRSAILKSFKMAGGIGAVKKVHFELF